MRTLLLIALASLAGSAVEAAQRFELSVIAESTDDRAAIDEAVSAAAAIYRTQLGVELIASYYDVNTVAAHTKPEALLAAVQTYRLDSPQHRASDATVLFTRRTLTRGYDGIATVGPSCSAAAAAVVELHSDGLDGETLAHELAHTVGVPHDAQPGYLMSDALARSSAPNFSADSVLTFKAAPADCMVVPVAVAASAPPAASAAAGGGGSADLWMLGVLAVMALAMSLQKVRADAVRDDLAHAGAVIAEFERDAPSDLALCDIICASAPINFDSDTADERQLIITFATNACRHDFQQWLRVQRHRAQMELFGGDSESASKD